MNPDTLNLKETSIHSPLKVYSDATSTDKTDLSVAGWVFCDHNGQVLDTLSQELGTNLKSCQSEAKALRRVTDGLADLSIVEHVILYTDCKPAIPRVDWNNLLEQFEQFSIEWVPRDKNKLADMVADKGLRRGANHTPSPNQSRYKVTD
jgi:ribonuclease HI